MKTENYKDIQGYEGLYQVSDLGNIKSVRTGKVLVQDTNINGYKTICLSKNGKQKRFRVHRLVLLAFKTKEHYSYVANHINGVRTDNRLENLEWCSQKENVRKGKRSIKIKDILTDKEYSCLKEVAELFSINYSQLNYAVKTNRSNFVII